MRYKSVCLFYLVLFGFEQKIEFVISQNSQEEIFSLKEEVYLKVDTMPTFIYGNNKLNIYISENLKMPNENILKQIEDYGAVSFIINKKGESKYINTYNFESESCSKEAKRVIESLKWKCGILKGKPINIQMTIPINFVLNARNNKIKNQKKYCDNYKSYSNINKEDVFLLVEEMPIFNFGFQNLTKYIESTIIYPLECLKYKIEGQVIVSFVVNKEGKSENIEILKSTNRAFNCESIRVISNLPKWKPAIHNSKPVNIKLTIPIDFKLSYLK